MENISGSLTNQLVGMGTRLNPETSKDELVSTFYPSYFRNVIRAFEIYPIAKHFGLDPESVMAMSVDRWYQIRNAAKVLAENQPPDSEYQMFHLLKEMIAGKKTVEE